MGSRRGRSHGGETLVVGTGLTPQFAMDEKDSPLLGITLLYPWCMTSQTFLDRSPAHNSQTSLPLRFLSVDIFIILIGEETRNGSFPVFPFD